ncbi:PAS domain S-box protein, partial [Acinetobacter sp. AGC35]
MFTLAEDSNILDQAFMKSPMGMALLAADEGSWVRVNSAFCNLFGCTESGMLATSLFSDIPFQEVLNELLDSPEATFRKEQRILTPGGSPVWLSLTFCLSDQGQAFSYIIVYAQDITDRKIADQLT